MRSVLRHTFVVGVFLAGANNAFAGFPIEGAQEVPPVVTGASGTCDVDITAGTIVVNCTFANLSSIATNAHIHAPGPVGFNAGVIIPLHFDAATSGTLVQDAPISPADTAHILDGNAYVNLHSVNHPGGELRGQITDVTSGGNGDPSVPAVSTWGIIILALLVLAGGKSIYGQRRTSAI